MIKLADLDPKIAENVLTFDCPTCRDHRIRVPLHPRQDHTGRAWSHFGTIAELTLTPSVDTGCFHGLIQGGNVIPC